MTADDRRRGRKKKLFSITWEDGRLFSVLNWWVVLFAGNNSSMYNFP